MGYHVTVKDILISGGPVLAFLILLSIYSIALIWERWRFYQKSLGELPRFMERLRGVVGKGKLAEAVALCREYAGAASSIVMASLSGPANRDARKRQVQRETDKALALLLERVTTLGTIAAVSPFIGLFGTVIGVMRAFQDLARTAGAGPGVIAVGISEALVCTAAGLFVAIPALVAYNYFNQKSGRFAEEMGWISDEIIDALSEHAAKS